MKTNYSYWSFVSLFVIGSFVSCSSDEVPHLNCVDNITTEFPFSNEIHGSLITDWEFGHYEIVLYENGTFKLEFREVCFDYLEDSYCGLTEADTFELQISGIWGPHSHLITNRENKRNCGGISNPFSSCEVLFTYNELFGTAPFTVLESNFKHYEDQSGIIEYMMRCEPIQGLPPVPPYRYFRQVSMYFDNDPFELFAYWQLEYDQ